MQEVMEEIVTNRHDHERHYWGPPAVLLDRVWSFAPVGLDPCASAQNVVRAKVQFPKDGCLRDWATEKGYTVFVNPPHSQLLQWARKMELEAFKGHEIIALLPVRPSTAWFRTVLNAEPLMLFWQGRLKFTDAEHAAPFASMLCYFGDREGRFRRAFYGCGWFAKELR